MPIHLLRLCVLSTATLVSVVAMAKDNECAAKVTPPKNLDIKGNLVTLTFKVETKCEASTGRFEYSYLSSTSPKRIDGTVPVWTAADGKSFSHKVSFNPGPNVTISDVKVDEDSIESKRIK